MATWSSAGPPSAPRDSRLLAVATCLEDPITGAGTPIRTPSCPTLKHVNDVTKNLVVEDAVAGTAMPPDQALSAEYALVVAPGPGRRTCDRIRRAACRAGRGWRSRFAAGPG